MHAMKLRVQTLRPALVSGARGALPLVGGRHNNVVVSLHERRATMQVMLGVSLRARWDATLVLTNAKKMWFIIENCICNNQIVISGTNVVYCNTGWAIHC